MRRFEVTRIDVSQGKAKRVWDVLAEEKNFKIILNQKYVIKFTCSPRQLKELSIGHLYSEGIITSLTDIQKISLKENVCHIQLQEKLPVKARLRQAMLRKRLAIFNADISNKTPRLPEPAGKPPQPKIKAQTVLNCVERLSTLGEIFRKTGGTHVSALFTFKGELIAYAEDVGRHNAFDKMVGATLLAGKTSLNRCFVVFSGRLSADLVWKTAHLGVPVLASIAAAIDSGVEAAQKMGVTLIGFARENRLNIYTFPERIIL